MLAYQEPKELASDYSRLGTRTFNSTGRERCDFDALLKLDPDHPVYWLTVFLKAKVHVLRARENAESASEEYNLARELYARFTEAKQAEIQFLRDDALYFEAISWMTEDVGKATELLTRLSESFGDTFDAKRVADYELGRLRRTRDG